MSLRIPRGVARWVCDFPLDRQQRVKLTNDCFSEWGPVPSGVPQGTKLGPWLFVVMINYLSPSDVQMCKYVDDTILAEVIPKDGQSSIQEAVNSVALWSRCNKLQLNVDKCKELTVDLKKIKQPFAPISINSLELDLVSNVKILGVTITDTLQLNNHVTEIIRRQTNDCISPKNLKEPMSH